ncbi:phage tail protein [Chryseobacterium sp. T16E-39]|uniref:phage tail protein n=1 Tax=Chryseobacterium sp. T16E-39 TaxID=2015076 RepID=UPI000B5B26E6|nr:tail fiber protein [Chryseobacterium sp. T16E-39]ASK31795.1 phage tail protein [Chryseobacterium sp. T16E-39]
MEEYMGIVKLFAGNFAPRNWMFCDGRLLSIAQNSALFSLLGTTYGGDGITTFALPNLIGRMALGAGNASGKSYPLGIIAGSDTTTLLQQNMPSMGGFQLKVANKNANSSAPTASSAIAMTGTQVGRDFNAVPSFVNDANPDTVINPQSISFTGQNMPVNNMPPYLGLNYIICIAGIYPSRE